MDIQTAIQRARRFLSTRGVAKGICNQYGCWDDPGEKPGAAGKTPGGKAPKAPKAASPAKLTQRAEAATQARSGKEGSPEWVKSTQAALAAHQAAATANAAAGKKGDAYFHNIVVSNLSRELEAHGAAPGPAATAPEAKPAAEAAKPGAGAVAYEKLPEREARFQAGTFGRENSEAVKHSEAEMAKLPAEQKDAIDKWSRGYDYAIREVDKGTPREELLGKLAGVAAARGESPEEHLAKAERYHAELGKAGASMQGIDRTVFRGLSGIDEATVHALIKNDTISLSHIQSASRDYRQALDFANAVVQDKDKFSVMMEIRQTGGMPIEAGSQFPQEAEVLLQKDSAYQIVDRYRTTDENGNRMMVVVAEQTRARGGARIGGR